MFKFEFAIVQYINVEFSFHVQNLLDIIVVENIYVM